MCTDLHFNKNPKWYLCTGVTVTSSTNRPGYVVRGQQNAIQITPYTSAPSVTGHAELYWAKQDQVGKYMNPNPPNPMNLTTNGPPTNSTATIDLPPGPNELPYVTASWDPSTEQLPVPNNVLVVARLVSHDNPNCPAAPAKFDPQNDPRCGATQATLITQAMADKNILPIAATVPLDRREQTAGAAFAISLRIPELSAHRTTLRATVLSPEHYVDAAVDVAIRDYMGSRRWTRAPGVKLALGVERLVLEEASSTRSCAPHLGHLGRITVEERAMLLAGTDGESESDLAIGVPLRPYEIRQGLLEIPAPRDGEYHVVHVRHELPGAWRPLEEFFFIVQEEESLGNSVSRSSSSSMRAAVEA